jgi:hypothetical protein
VLVDPPCGVWVYRRLVRRVRAGVANARAAEKNGAIARHVLGFVPSAEHA